ncbi:MAG: M24 family metallopeptidase [Solirubrobacterales bacterium]
MIDRVERLAALAAERQLDALIVGDLVRPGDSGRSDMVNLRWLTGFAGTSGAAIVGPDSGLFITDFRYVDRVENEVEGLELARAERQLVPAIAERLEGRIGFDEAHTSVQVFERLEQLVPDSVELVPSAGMVEQLRRRKDAAEVARIREAAKVADEAYARAIEGGLAGRTEREVAATAAAAIRELGAEPSFPAIVAAGPNGALPHAEPSDREIGAGELIVFDMGAELDGYCSDCTRTFAAGEPEPDARDVYELVLAAQTASLEATSAGVGGKHVDAVARERITAAGHGEEFGHGVGHGVGVEVHEAPRLGQRSEDVLEAGDVVTIEPGVYVNGRFGVRIEDLVVVTDEGYENLSGLSKKLTVVG